METINPILGALLILAVVAIIFVFTVVLIRSTYAARSGPATTQRSSSRYDYSSGFDGRGGDGFDSGGD